MPAGSQFLLRAGQLLPYARELFALGWLPLAELCCSSGHLHLVTSQLLLLLQVPCLCLLLLYISTPHSDRTNTMKAGDLQKSASCCTSHSTQYSDEICCDMVQHHAKPMITSETGDTWLPRASFMPEQRSVFFSFLHIMNQMLMRRRIMSLDLLKL